VKDTKDIQEL